MDGDLSDCRGFITAFYRDRNNLGAGSLFLFWHQVCNHSVEALVFDSQLWGVVCDALLLIRGHLNSEVVLASILHVDACDAFELLFKAGCIAMAVGFKLGL